MSKQLFFISGTLPRRGDEKSGSRAMKILGAFLDYACTHARSTRYRRAYVYTLVRTRCNLADWRVTSTVITKRGSDGPPIRVSGFIVTADDRWLGNGSRDSPGLLAFLFPFSLNPPVTLSFSRPSSFPIMIKKTWDDSSHSTITLGVIKMRLRRRIYVRLHKLVLLGERRRF